VSPWAVGKGYELGSKFDKSPNKSAWPGAERFEREPGVAYHEIEGGGDDDQRVHALSELIRHGVTAAGLGRCAAMGGH
jgi:hypothetical protein